MTNEEAINIGMQEAKREMADRKNDTLIIKCEVNLRLSELEALRKTIQKQMDEGIVLLPWYLTLQERNLCDSCKTKGCIFQYGIVRSHCDFYKAESEVEK